MRSLGILETRLKHRPFSQAVSEQLARWLVANGKSMDVRCDTRVDATGGQLAAGRKADGTAVSGWASWMQIAR
jgi:hypothetical protein